MIFVWFKAGNWIEVKKKSFFLDRMKDCFSQCNVSSSVLEFNAQVIKQLFGITRQVSICSTISFHLQCYLTTASVWSIWSTERQFYYVFFRLDKSWFCAPFHDIMTFDICSMPISKKCLFFQLIISHKLLITDYPFFLIFYTWFKDFI